MLYQMKPTRQRINNNILIFTLIGLMLGGCTSMYPNVPLPNAPLASLTPLPAALAPAPLAIELPNPAFDLAQATKDAGQSQLLDLARKSTEVALAIAQAANSSALSTQDFNQRRKMDLDFQATVISLNIAQAAATQKFITNQTKSARDAAAAAQNRALTATQAANLVIASQTARAEAVLEGHYLQTAQVEATLTASALTATYSAYLLNINETSQAQLYLDAQAAQAAQEIADKTAVPMTQTPFAATQAALLMQQYGREQQSFVDQIVAPFLPILAAIVLVLFILVIVRAYRRYTAKAYPRSLRIGGADSRDPASIIDGVIRDPLPELPQDIPVEPAPAPLHELAENLVHVELVDPTEPPFAHWIAEVEQQMAVDGGPRL
jgi:hypothetical protein